MHPVSRWTHVGFDATEQHDGPCWGPVRDQLRPSVFEASGPDVEITDTYVKVKTLLENDQGTSSVELYYDLVPR